MLVSPPPSHFLSQPHSCSSPSPYYRTAPTFTFHPYSPPASPPPLPPPASTPTNSLRPAAPFPTFLYANEPPPVTARNRQRVRPNPSQLADLKALFATSPHPSRDAREALGRRIGMRYQSVTNWFQNQRSTARRRTPGTGPTEPDDASLPDSDHDPAPPPPPPPPPPRPPHPVVAPPHRRDPVRDIIAQASTRPATAASAAPAIPLTLPPAPTYYTRRAPSPSPPAPPPAPPPALSPLLSIFPTNPPVPRTRASRNSAANGNTKRSRPTPGQLAVLRALHRETDSPSIEEREQVGLAIGMELGKVTNWFRNLRQTARKKERRTTTAGGEGEGEGEAASVVRKRSRADGDDAREGDAKRAREGYGTDEETDGMDLELDGEREYSEMGTEDDAAHEAVTPEPLSFSASHPHSPSVSPHSHLDPIAPATTGSHANTTTPPPTTKLAGQQPQASIDDALLLLALHDARA